MSVGGKVIDVIIKDGKVYIDTNDGYSNCAVYLELNEDSKNIKVGDKLWWQGNESYWTKKDLTRIEVTIKRIGFSGVKKPK